MPSPVSGFRRPLSPAISAPTTSDDLACPSIASALGDLIEGRLQSSQRQYAHAFYGSAIALVQFLFLA
jgi:hypothetical protein